MKPATEPVASSGRPLVLFVSNGYGEDTIAASIVERLMAPGSPVDVAALPMVGEGQAYRRLGVEMVGPSVLLPSGGLILARWANIWNDFRAGLWNVTLQQIAALRRFRGRFGALVAVGDTYPALMGALFARRRVIMVGTAKSNYFCPYSPIERFIFRRCCEVVFARDEPTAATLRSQGVVARWVGNAMMDSLGVTGRAVAVADDRPCLALLPGSRQVAYQDLPVILGGLALVARQRPARGLMALSDSLDLELLGRAASEGGWTLEARPRPEDGVEGWLRREGTEVVLVRGRLGDVVAQSVLVVGQAGTGNEQAVGMGKPVVSFDSDGRKNPGWYRARQKGLLGDSLAVVDRSSEAVAREVAAILDDAALYRRMQEAGYDRMGPPGASGEMAAYIVDHLHA